MYFLTHEAFGTILRILGLKIEAQWFHLVGTCRIEEVGDVSITALSIPKLRFRNGVRLAVLAEATMLLACFPIAQRSVLALMLDAVAIWIFIRSGSLADPNNSFFRRTGQFLCLFVIGGIFLSRALYTCFFFGPL